MAESDARPAPPIVLLALGLCTGALAGCLAGDEGDPGTSSTPPHPSPGPGGRDRRATAPSAGDGEPGGFSNTHVFPGNYDANGSISQPLEPGSYAIEDPRVLALTSDVDGADVQIAIVRPDVPEDDRVPVIAVASPYWPPLTRERLTGEADPSSPHFSYQLYAERFVPHGYAVAMIPVRGSGGSGGCSDLMGPKEQADLDQAVTWLGERDWSTGKVGMVGISYTGSTPWEVAATGNPHLETIVPIAGLSSLYHALYNNGSQSVGSYGYFPLYYHGAGVAAYGPTDGRPAEKRAHGALCPAAARAYVETTRSSQTLAYSDFWAARDHRDDVEANYTGSVLLVHGLEDVRVPPMEAYPWVSRLDEQGWTVKHLLGRWPHSYPDLPRVNGEGAVRWDFAEILLHWFDYWLEGDTTRDLGPRVQVQDTDGRWQSMQRFPPREANRTRLHLAPNGTLARRSTAGTGSVLVGPDPDDRNHPGALLVPSSPGPSTICPTCPAFETRPLDEALRFAGWPTLALEATPTGPGGHVSATLYATDGDGRRNLTHGQVDLRAGDGDRDHSRVGPGESVEATLTFEPTAAVVHAGERLGLALDQGSYGEHWPAVPTYPVEVATGDGRSTLRLDVYELDPTDRFVPPETGNDDAGR